MRNPDRSWPPLIDNAALPSWMKWRDTTLTLVMWVVFGWLLRRQFALVDDGLIGNANLTAFLTLLRPYANTAILLIVLLLIAAAFTALRRRRAYRVPEPPPLALAVEARRAGMNEAGLVAARSLRIAVVQIDQAGRLEIEPRRSMVKAGVDA